MLLISIWLITSNLFLGYNKVFRILAKWIIELLKFLLLSLMLINFLNIDAWWNFNTLWLFCRLIARNYLRFNFSVSIWFLLDHSLRSLFLYKFTFIVFEIIFLSVDFSFHIVKAWEITNFKICLMFFWYDTFNRGWCIWIPLS